LEKAIICFSGGHSSALVAIEAVRKYGKNNVILLNHDISSHVEHKDIKRFKREVANYLELPITYANAESFEEMTPLKVALMYKGFQFQPGNALCTKYLKTDPFYKYLEQIPKLTDFHILYGFDAEEINRIQRRTDIVRAMGYTAEFPLADWDRTLENTEDIGIKRPATYRVYKHANCIGCLKAGRQHWYCVYCLRPDIWQEAKAAERELGYSIIKDAYLEELEPKFYVMKHSKGICPNDKENGASFWARVEQTLPEQMNFLPCDCAF